MQIKNHLNHNLPPAAHTPIYNWHKFWSRKTWNVVAEYIKTYCPEDGIVFDPFAGSGVTAIEALRNGRRAIVCDILPIATEIIRLTIKPISEKKLMEGFTTVEEKVKTSIQKLYETTCRNCSKSIVIDCSIWHRNTCKDVRYVCPYCGDERAGKCAPNAFDSKLLKHINKQRITEWHPRNRLYYPDGFPFKEKQRYESLDELFTKRNLMALAQLMDAIECADSNTRDFLKIAFSSMVHLCSKMMPDRPSRPYSSVWSQHSYWSAATYMEQNVWNKFESAMFGPQGLIKAKTEANAYFSSSKIAAKFQDVYGKKVDIYIHTGSCLDLLDEMPDDSVDYIFTDPPYDSSVQFGELAYLWVAWLKLDDNYLQTLMTDEIVRNENQHKNFDVYHRLLSRAFRGMYRVLKPESYCTVTFHNPTFKVRNATIRAAVFSGFDFQKIHHQELARPSAKSLLQPFGSAVGDFYIRFYKPRHVAARGSLKEITVDRFERIVVETTKQLLSERAEPTPYTHIINYIDPMLAKEGYFSGLDTGLDVKTVLQNFLNVEFTLVKGNIGKTTGEMWWFKDPSVSLNLKRVPLSERVEQTIYRKLRELGRMTFTEAWAAVSEKFPNSLTTDQTSIREALELYARPVSKGVWMLKPEVVERESQHNDIIVALAEIGKSLGYKIWIGKKEQGEKAKCRFKGAAGEERKLSEYVNYDIRKLKDVVNLQVVQFLDLLWIIDNRIFYAFEIEATTSMTDALIRGSNLKREVLKFLVLPDERESQLLSKMKSPMFQERFKGDKWAVLFFDTVFHNYHKLKSKSVGLEDLVSKKIQRKVQTPSKSSQLGFQL